MLLGYRARQLFSLLGAMIVVLCIAVDPFTQQLVTTNSCPVSVAGEDATIARPNFIAFKNPTAAIRYEQPILPDLRFAVISGLYAKSHDANIVCSIGNCTFAQNYPSVGFRSSCENISGRIKVSYTC
ncbi:hypothetical protein F5Y16DRAFT_80611 [Xylariaceae sp. FL0255]|nr:hypothetical protein F5Y16DRAFT_80611 [Xylariaceae sp. FL0255]